MSLQDGVWNARWKAASGVGRAIGRGLTDLLLPTLAHDTPRAMATPGLTAAAWSRITFLEDPVCDGCGAGFAADAGDFAGRCAACIAEPYLFARARAACVYDDASRDLILQLKHGDHQPFAPLFAHWISRAAAPLLDQADAIVPVPLHPIRLLSRRFNQSAEIARPLAKTIDVPFVPDALIRLTHTPSQGGKSARGRRLNVQKAFAITAAGARRVEGQRILLVDDVLTTGATAGACARALLDAGATAVDLAVVARVRSARQLPT